MVEAAPPAPFVVPKPDLLLEFLIVALDAPAQFGQIDELREADVLWQRGEPVFGWLCFALRPFDQQPLRRQLLGEPTRTRTRAKREDSWPAEPSRHVTVRQACFGRPSATFLAETSSGSSRRPVLFIGLSIRRGPLPGAHIKMVGTMPTA